MEGGLSMDAWLNLWLLCHASTSMGTWRLCWPDGGGTLQQPALTVAMFELISTMALEVRSGDG